jgi:hypothetical protein
MNSSNLFGEANITLLVGIAYHFWDLSQTTSSDTQEVGYNGVEFPTVMRLQQEELPWSIASYAFSQPPHWHR